MGLFPNRARAVEDVPAVPLITPQPSVDGWTLAGTPLAARLGREHHREVATLLHGVGIRVDTPYTYERASALLERLGEYEQALSVCEAWLTHPAASRPTSAGTTKLVMKRRSRLRLRVSENRGAEAANAS
jgi:hypothetical protein